MKEADPIAAHKFSIRHEKQLLVSELCGCFYCTHIFSPMEINEWIEEAEDENGRTALCPKCGIDSVIGSAAGYPITKEFLKKMQKAWF